MCGHGLVTEDDIGAIEAAFRSAPPQAETVLLLHHHPLPLPDGDELALFWRVGQSDGHVSP